MARKPMSVREEIRQSKPFDSIAQEAVLALSRTADRVQREFVRVIEPHGISAQQYNVLRILRGAGEKGLPTLEITERMVEQTPGITRLLDKLEAKQLVRRRRCPSDRRQVLCWITASGLNLLAELDTPVTETGAHSMQSLTNQQLHELIGLLDQLRAGLG